MTLRLILTRHAKSDWDNPLDTDHQRPLSARGQRAAPAMGAWLAARGHVPGEALVSDATRTRETWALLAPAFGAEIPVRFERNLYLAGPDMLRRVLRTAQAPVVMLIAHNPGIGELAQALVPRPLDHPAFLRYPTAATLIVEFDIPNWADLTQRATRILDFIVPRDLPDHG
ncbi:MAG: SixA phosphatase family protein [Roseinatronobacter sp.]